MYDFIEVHEDDLREMYELGMIPIDQPMSDADADAAELQMAFDAGFDAFSGLTPSEYLASLGDVSFGERCGSQFAEEVPA